MPRLRFSTSTLAGEEFVPWLASDGELAYSPHSPPERDYFQYSRVSPELKLLFAFWNKARRDEVDALYVSNGKAGLEDISAPLAVYRHSEVNPFAGERLILIQQGSYLIADIKSQPYIDRKRPTNPS